MKTLKLFFFLIPFLLVSIFQMQAQNTENWSHTHVMVHGMIDTDDDNVNDRDNGHGGYADHTHRQSHTHQFSTTQSDRDAHVKMWPGTPEGDAAVANHSGVGRLSNVPSDQVCGVLTEDRYAQQRRIIHNHIFEHDDGQGYMHTHYYVHGHTSSSRADEYLPDPGHSHNHVGEFRNHGSHTIGQKHVLRWSWVASNCDAEEGDSYIVRRRYEHFHIIQHNHTNGYTVGGQSTEHYS